MAALSIISHLGLGSTDKINYYISQYCQRSADSINKMKKPAYVMIIGERLIWNGSEIYCLLMVRGGGVRSRTGTSAEQEHL